MESNSKFNWQVRTAAASIFLLGFVAGALALNAYSVWFGGAAQPTRHEQYQRVFEQLALSDSQNVEIQKIVGDMRREIQDVKKSNEPKFQEIRTRSNEKFRQVMTPEQWENFQRLRNEIKEKEKQAEEKKQK